MAKKPGGEAKYSINFIKGVRDGEYDDVIDAAFAGKRRFGSAVNALAVFARESPTFRQIRGEIERESLEPKTRKRGKR